MERMVNDRLTHCLDGRGVPECDPLGSVHNREVLVAVFLDIEKADDMLWRDGLFLNLQSYVIIQVRVEFVPIANLTL